MEDTPKDREDWARLLKNEWENRSHSPFCHYFINTHPEWDDPEQWELQGRMHSEFILSELEPDTLKDLEVLEIGCGVGRLAPHLKARTRGYTGFDISSGMIREARERYKDQPGMRFFVSDGLAVPLEAQDRRYNLAIALAVFIHCPRDVIESLITSAYSLLTPGGELRLQLLADPEDPTGIEIPSLADAIHEEHKTIETGAPNGAMDFIEGRYYMGTRFKYEEAKTFLMESTGGEMKLRRYDLTHIYAGIRK